MLGVLLLHRAACLLARKVEAPMVRIGAWIVKSVRVVRHSGACVRHTPLIGSLLRVRTVDRCLADSATFQLPGRGVRGLFLGHVRGDSS